MRFLAGVLVTLVCAAPAAAFDSGPHGDMTVDAMRYEGFGQTAAEVAQLENYLVDFYSQYSKDPYSGHADKKVAAAAQPIDPREYENWAPAVMEAAERSHFDAMGVSVGYVDTPAVTAEWSRLRRATYKLLQGAKARHNPLDVLAIIGMSLHELQDFYAHSNWVERTGDGGSAAPFNAGTQGSVPTFFDVPADQIGDVYTTTDTQHRSHGSWQEDGNLNLLHGMNKDWSGRPRFPEAYMTGYFATRQWVQAMRRWLGDDALWGAAQRFSGTAAMRSGLRRDIDVGDIRVSRATGHWAGEGGPCEPGTSSDPPWGTCGSGEGYGGTLLGARSAIKDYHGDADPTIFRRTFENLITGLDDRGDELAGVTDADVPVASSRAMQAAIEFVRLRFLNVAGIDLEDPTPTDGADLYTRASILGQEYISAVIDDHDSFGFPMPYGPYTFMRAVTRGRMRSEPVTDMTVTISTGDVRWAGTDDDVYLRISPTERFPLDKALYDDFERGDRDTYSVPIDDLARRGFTREDIQYLQIEKSSDGAAGGWRLGGFRVRVNGSTLYANDHVDRWLEDDHRTYRANIPRDHRTPGTALPVWMEIFDEDGFVYGGDDEGDINAYDNRDAAVHPYTLGTSVTRTVTGGSTYGGRIGKGGDKARVTYAIDTLTPQLPPAAPITTTPPVVLQGTSR